MSFTLTISEEVYASIHSHLFKDASKENAGYVLARLSTTAIDTRLLAREFIPVKDEHIISSDSKHISIRPESFISMLKYVDDSKQCLLFVHSHPDGFNNFSEIDDQEEGRFFRTVYIRIHHESFHGSMVFPKGNHPIGRVWLPNGEVAPITRIRIIGNRFHFYGNHESNIDIPNFYDRQVRAFGKDVQRLLQSLHIGVVGLGGTGSAVSEQLIRLGIGTLSIYDLQNFDESNVNRVFGSRVSDNHDLKVNLIRRMAEDIGLKTKINVYNSNITHKETAMTLRECDIIFGCTDDQWGRSILNEIAYRYIIPVIDMGVKISSENNIIQSIIGRVTILYPGAACLFCRNRITPTEIKAEVDQMNNPDEAKKLRREGYAPELAEPDPAVISFTSGIASVAVSELLQRITGYMGEDRKTTEILFMFHENRLRTNSTPPVPDCKCMQKEIFGKGDTRDFLGLLWD